MATLEDRPHLLFFTTFRSGPGRRMESLLAQLARKERKRLRVSRVDSDRVAKLAQRLTVNEVPTLVLLVGGRQVARIEGRASAPQIERMLEAHLPAGNPDASLAA
jgi:thioredoxin-like negative regulator of GroEL